MPRHLNVYVTSESVLDAEAVTKAIAPVRNTMAITKATSIVVIVV